MLIWSYLVPSGHLAPFGTSDAVWDHLGSGAIRCHLGPAGVICCYLMQSGAIWNYQSHLEPTENIWGRLEVLLKRHKPARAEEKQEVARMKPREFFYCCAHSKPAREEEEVKRIPARSRACTTNAMVSLPLLLLLLPHWLVCHKDVMLCTRQTSAGIPA